MLREELDRCLQEVSQKPLCTLQASYMVKGVEPDSRFGYCCEELADTVVEHVNSLGYDSYKIKPKNLMHISTLSIDRNGRIYLADPGLLIKNVVDVTDVLKKPGAYAYADCYSEIPGRKVEIKGTEDGFEISKPSINWMFNTEQNKKFKFHLGILKNQTLRAEMPRRIVPLIRVVDDGMPLSILLTPYAHYVKGYGGHVVCGDTSKLESRILELIGNGLTINDLRRYTDRCIELYNGKSTSETLVLQKQ
ncbi:hypothetical protein KY345_03380 [Candidatus Woesearchaeota archaeon]|nr:hypothetical protein [Candidatus Woesearchaeota archaeon]